MRVPEDLHLGARGEITCITCHMPHLPYLDKRTGGRTYFLRRSILKRELCLACHYEEKFVEPTSHLRIIAPVDNSIVKSLPVPFIGIVSDDAVKGATLFINNAPIRLSNVVISELMYHPISGNDDDQYIELYNRGSTAVNLGGWQLSDGISFTFPSNTVLAADGYVVVARNAQRPLDS